MVVKFVRKKKKVYLQNGSLAANPMRVERRDTSKPALLNALIYKNVKQLPTFFDLASTLIDNPPLATTCGLQLNKTLYRLEERLSSFLKDIPNGLLETTRINLVNRLIQLNQISVNFLSIDSAAVVRENNPKTSDERWIQLRHTHLAESSCSRLLVREQL